MFDWLRHFLGRSENNERQRLFSTIDELNAEAGGGQPTKMSRSLGRLKLRSKTLVFGDPQCVLDLEVPNVNADKVEISATLWRYPSGVMQIISLNFQFGGSTVGTTQRQIREIRIESGKLIVADLADIQKHWLDIGRDRIGVISTARDDAVLQLLTKRFKLKTRLVSAFRAEVVGPVSRRMAAEIESFLKTNPKYADFPFVYFRLETNNSFDRANQMDRAWQFLPIGNNPEPVMFVCGTGRGDGRYDVMGQFQGDELRSLEITFVED